LRTLVLVQVVTAMPATIPTRQPIKALPPQK
jgi:hypothetical protein